VVKNTYSQYLDKSKNNFLNSKNQFIFELEKEKEL